MSQSNLKEPMTNDELRNLLIEAINTVTVRTDDLIGCDRVELQEFFNRTLKGAREAVTNALHRADQCKGEGF